MCSLPESGNLESHRNGSLMFFSYCHVKIERFHLQSGFPDSIEEMDELANRKLDRGVGGAWGRDES